MVGICLEKIPRKYAPLFAYKRKAGLKIFLPFPLGKGSGDRQVFSVTQILILGGFSGSVRNDGEELAEPPRNDKIRVRVEYRMRGVLIRYIERGTETQA